MFGGLRANSNSNSKLELDDFEPSSPPVPLDIHHWSRGLASWYEVSANKTREEADSEHSTSESNVVWGQYSEQLGGSEQFSLEFVLLRAKQSKRAT